MTTRRNSKLLWVGAAGIGATGTLWVLLRRYFAGKKQIPVVVSVNPPPARAAPENQPARATTKQFAQAILRAAEDPKITFVWQDWWRVMEELFPEADERLKDVLVFATIKNTLVIKIPRAVQTATTTLQLMEVIEWIDSLPGQWHDWMEALGVNLGAKTAATLHLTAGVPLSDKFKTEIAAARTRIAAGAE